MSEQSKPEDELLSALRGGPRNGVEASLVQAINMFREKNKEYGNNYEHFGLILKTLFPSGMKLETGGDFARASNLFNIISKLSRYCKNYSTGGHEDSAIDSIVYWAIQQELDNVENGEYADRVAEETRACSCKKEDERVGERRISHSPLQHRKEGHNGVSREGLERRIKDLGREARGPRYIVDTNPEERRGKERRGEHSKTERYYSMEIWSRNRDEDRRTKKGTSKDRASQPIPGVRHGDNGPSE